ncbi:hypothetical protein P879_12018, partial [Paragonimus westermani]
PVAQTSVCIPSTPAPESPDGRLAGSQTLPIDTPAPVGADPSYVSISTSHECPHCARCFTTIPGLKNAHDRDPTLHLTSTYGAFGYRCSQCRRQFTSDRGLSQHRRRAHPTEYNAYCLARLPTSRYKEPVQREYQKRLQLLRLERSTAASALQPIVMNPQVLVGTSPRVNTRDMSISDIPAPPSSPIIGMILSSSPTVRDLERNESTATSSPPSDRSTQTIYTPRGSSSSDVSSLEVEWQSPILLSGNSTTTPTSEGLHNMDYDNSQEVAQSTTAVSSVIAGPKQRLAPAEGSPHPQCPPLSPPFYCLSPHSSSSESSTTSPLTGSSGSSASFSSDPIRHSATAHLPHRLLLLPVASQSAAPGFSSSSPRLQQSFVNNVQQVNENDVHDAMLPVCKQIHGSPHSQPSGARGVNPRTLISSLLHVDLDESEEAATPQTLQTASVDENHNVSEEHRPTLEEPETQPSMVPVDISSLLLEKAHRVLSDVNNRDKASNTLLAIVDNQLHQPTGLKNFQCDLEEFCRKWYPHRWVRKKKKHTVLSRPINRRQRRRLQYGHIQNLYRRSRKDAASTVLNGRWREAFASVQAAPLQPQQRLDILRYHLLP